MNVLISFLTVYHILKVTENRFPLSLPSRILLLLGTLLPLGDSVVRFFIGEYRFQNGDWYFHSFIYQGLFWSTLALLFWVYCRDIKSSIRLLTPLVGLLFYTFYALLGAVEIPLLTPISDFRFHAGGLYIGYWVPVSISLLLLLLRYWLKLSPVKVNLTGIGVILFFLLSMTVVLSTIDKALTKPFREAEKVSILPGNYSQTLWNVAAFSKTQYTHDQYHLIKGWQQNKREIDFFSATDLAQKELEDPSIKNLYFYSFNHPTLNVSVEDELLKIELVETSPVIDLLWISKIQITKNIADEILDMKVSYKLFGIEIQDE